MATCWLLPPGPAADLKRKHPLLTVMVLQSSRILALRELWELLPFPFSST